MSYSYLGVRRARKALGPLNPRRQAAASSISADAQRHIAYLRNQKATPFPGWGCFGFDVHCNFRLPGTVHLVHQYISTLSPYPYHIPLGNPSSRPIPLGEVLDHFRRGLLGASQGNSKGLLGVERGYEFRNDRPTTPQRQTVTLGQSPIWDFWHIMDR